MRFSMSISPIRESSESTLHREILEETGISSANIIWKEGNITNTIPKDNIIKERVVYLYSIQTVTDQVTLSDEHGSYAWFTYEETLKHLPFENIRKLFLTTK